MRSPLTMSAVAREFVRSKPRPLRISRFHAHQGLRWFRSLPKAKEVDGTGSPGTAVDLTQAGFPSSSRCVQN
jgi:hypothetical protein